MTVFAEIETPAPIGAGLVVGAVFLGLIISWNIIASRLWLGKPLIPREPRRPVPWKGIDLVAIVVFWLSLEMIGVSIVAHFTEHLADAAPGGEASAQHPIALLMAEGNVFLLLVSGLAAVVVAPVFEEFMFRVLLQGWLEGAFGRLRWVIPEIGSLSVLMPIAISSLMFAMIHYREAAAPSNVWLLAYFFIATSITRLWTMILVIAFLKFVRGATAADFGWSASHSFADAVTGVVTFGAISVPLFAIMILLNWALPNNPWNDPAALFPLAVILGILYYRTHRIMPVIALHMSLNLTSLTVAWLGQ